MMVAGYIEIAIGIIAIAVVFFVLNPYVPSWAVYAGAVVGAFLWLVDLLEDGPAKQNVGASWSSPWWPWASGGASSAADDIDASRARDATLECWVRHRSPTAMELSRSR